MSDLKVLRYEDLLDAEGNVTRAIARVYQEIEHNDKLYRVKGEIESALNVMTEGNFWIDEQDFVVSPLFQSLIENCGSGEGPRDERCDAFARFTAAAQTRDNLYSEGEAERFAQFEATKLAEIDKIKSSHNLTRFFDVRRFYEEIPLYGELIKLPQEILTLLLMMFMGLLGSVIAMTWSFVRMDDDLSPRRFMLLPFIGSMSALIILVFLKAGQLSINASGAEVPLDPFFISFVGIVSGMLSERAYTRISTIGSDFFSVNQDVRRWAIGLNQAIEASGVNLAQLSSLLSMPEDQIREIAERKRSASGEEQQALSLALRVRQPEIFSDLPPVSS
ncbi:hypothetical protein [Amaricoccus sp.]|uniref:hypothetical protein n=1 Tax=Amaricoccus sp. TaxID=1872485 RepID=UPI001B3D3ACA|nr:hypothetical protein [Amaricoccus sp.]MBP7000388.1 hypothetical protein [Amaricoccus sp.]